MKVQRRKLRFQSLEDAIADAENLLNCGYIRTGSWDLTQCCDHLSRVMLYPIDGFPKFPIRMRIGTFVLRYTLAPIMLNRIFRNNEWPQGLPTDPHSAPELAGKDDQAVQQLRLAIQRLLSFEGPLKVSPLFGLLNKQQLVQLHRIHTAHHLGFLVPNNL